jgi:hypothetical protein
MMIVPGASVVTSRTLWRLNCGFTVFGIWATRTTGEPCWACVFGWAIAAVESKASISPAAVRAVANFVMSDSLKAKSERS